MSFAQFGGFFLDTCILLPHSLESVRESCAAFLKNESTRCFLCSSVKDEALALTERSYMSVISTLRSDLKPFLQQRGVQKLTNRSGRILADFFMQERASLKSTHHQRNANVRNELIGIVENYVAIALHSLKDGLDIGIDDFLASIMTELASAKHKLETPFNTLNTVVVTPDRLVTGQIVLRTMITNDSDARHLSSALQHQFQENKWIVFVTTDATDILSRQKDILEIFALHCSKPEWAPDYFREITRMNAPVDFYRQKKNYTIEQKEFGDVVEKVMGIKILG